MTAASSAVKEEVVVQNLERCLAPARQMTEYSVRTMAMGRRGETVAVQPEHRTKEVAAAMVDVQMTVAAQGRQEQQRDGVRLPVEAVSNISCSVRR